MGKTVQVLKSPRVKCWSWYPSSPHSQLPRLFAPSPKIYHHDDHSVDQTIHDCLDLCDHYILSRWSLCWSSKHPRLSWFVWSSVHNYHHRLSEDLIFWSVGTQKFWQALLCQQILWRKMMIGIMAATIMLMATLLHTCKKRVVLRRRLFWPKKNCRKSA